MKTNEQKELEKIHDFMFDVKSLIKQYGFSFEQAMSIFEAKPKTDEELLLDKAVKMYPSGTAFIPVGKKKVRISEGVPEWICGIIWQFDSKQKLRVLFRDGMWAEIVKE